MADYVRTATRNTLYVISNDQRTHNPKRDYRLRFFEIRRFPAVPRCDPANSIESRPVFMFLVVCLRYDKCVIAVKWMYRRRSGSHFHLSPCSCISDPTTIFLLHLSSDLYYEKWSVCRGYWLNPIDKFSHRSHNTADKYPPRPKCIRSGVYYVGIFLTTCPDVHVHVARR